jgi:hypothetical protein
MSASFVPVPPEAEESRITESRAWPVSQLRNPADLLICSS